MGAPDVHVCEVGLRDGLQLVTGVVPTATKTALLDALVAAGFAEMDVTSFVPPQVVPQFFDAAAVMAHARSRHPGLGAGALVPNVKGAERAIAADATALFFVASVSRGHSRANVRREPEEQVAALGAVHALIHARPASARPRLVGALATAFGCSIDGRIAPAAVARMAVAMAEAGAEEIVLADTVGYADPRRIREVLAAVRGAIGGALPLRLHLHDTMGLGLANALAGLEAGITRFDAALGGLGGCPFAPGASGNIATEDLVFMLEQMGLSTGIDLSRLLAASALLSRSLPQERLRSHVAEAGIPRLFGAGA
jgi:hydroxymethylglutaryl-CoA lyase